MRLKNAMQEFSDKLDTDERVLLAQEIGGDGTLIRWSTTEVEALGWQVTNNPDAGGIRRDVGRLDPGFVPGAIEEQMAIGALPLARRQSRKVTSLWCQVLRFT